MQAPVQVPVREEKDQVQDQFREEKDQDQDNSAHPRKYHNNIQNCIRELNRFYYDTSTLQEKCYNISNRKFFKFVRALSVLSPRECKSRYLHSKPSLKKQIEICFPKIITDFESVEDIEYSYLDYCRTVEIQEELDIHRNCEVYTRKMTIDDIELIKKKYYSFTEEDINHPSFDEYYSHDPRDKRPYYKLLDEYYAISSIISKIDNHGIALNITKINPYLFHMLPERFRESYEIGLVAVQKDIRTYRFTNTDLRDDKDLALSALKQNPALYKYVGLKLRNDRDLALPVLEKDVSLFEHFGNELRNDREVALSVLNKDTKLYVHIGTKLKNDFEFTFSLIKKIPSLFGSLSLKFRNTQEIAIVAINYNEKYLCYVGSQLKDNIEFAFYIIKKDVRLLEFFSERVINNEELMTVAMEREYVAFKFAGNKLKNNKEFILSVVSRWILSYIPYGLYTDSDFLVSVILKTRLDLDYVMNHCRLTAGAFVFKRSIADEIHNKINIVRGMFALDNFYIKLDGLEVESLYNYM